MADFRIYHVARNAAKHNYELDDKLYGAPLEKKEEDWAIKAPNLYIQRVKDELAKVNVAIEDVAYLMREKGVEVQIPERADMTFEEADAYAYHKFHVRQFEYAEKLSQMLQSKAPEEIELNIPKAKRQLSILLAAKEDLEATLTRFTAYAESL